MVTCEPRGAVQDSLVRFRVSSALLTRTTHAAAREGVSVSEFVRSAIRREIGAV